MIQDIMPESSNLWFDNFYTSHKIIADLSDLRINAAGTCRLDRLKL